MKKYFKIIIIILVSLNIVNIFGSCMNSKNKEKELLNILIEEPKKSDEYFINTIIQEYKNENKNVDVTIKFSKDIEESKKVLINEKIDLIFCPRNSMIELSRQGLLKDINNVYESADINSRFYNIVCSYGRYNNRYYGIGLMPYSLNLLINKNAVKGFLQDKEIIGVNNLIDIALKYNKEIPIILNEDMDLSSFLGLFIANNVIMDNKIEENFSDDKSRYIKIKDVQKSFEFMDKIVTDIKANKINFIETDEKTIDDVQNEKKTIILTTSLILKNVSKDNNLQVISKILNDKYKISPSIIIDHNVCVLEDGKNIKQINNFLNFISKDDVYIKLAKEGYASGNTLAATYIEGIQRNLMWIISLANENNIPFYFNLPNKMKTKVLEEFKNIMEGKYDRKEWERVVQKSF